MSDTLTNLLHRVEAASGADREIDRDLWWVLDRPAAEHAFWTGALGMPRPLGDNMPEGLGKASVRVMSPKLTASLDAALALVERRLPDQPVAVGTMAGLSGQPWATIWTPFGEPKFYGWAATPALALLAALLRAEITRATPKDPSHG